MQPSAKPVDAPILAVEGLTLTHAFLPRPSLENLSLGLAPGERALLLGPSGCGKTSLALCLNAIIPRAIPASVAGRIDVAGEPVSSRQTGDWAEVIAYVFQDPESQLCALTVEEEIAFALENRSLPPAEIDRRIDATLSQVGLPVG